VEVASGLLVNFRPAGGGVRTFENSTLNGEGLSRALSGTGDPRDGTGERERSGTRISGRVGGFDVIRVCSSIIGREGFDLQFTRSIDNLVFSSRINDCRTFRHSLIPRRRVNIGGRHLVEGCVIMGLLWDGCHN